MTKRVLSVGQCGPDAATLRSYVERNFDAQVLEADDLPATLAALAAAPVALVLVNRHLDFDYSEGLAVIRRIKADPQHGAIPCMLVSNYPDSQQAAIAAGCAPGFGKLEYVRPETRAKLAEFLDPR